MIPQVIEQCGDQVSAHTGKKKKWGHAPIED
jgi:hypothetical protein